MTQPRRPFDRARRARFSTIVARLAVGLASVCVGIAVCAGGAVARNVSLDGLVPHTTAHVETWSFDDSCNGGSGASAALVRRWLTFAETNCGATATKSRANCRSGGKVYCLAIQYLDTNVGDSNSLLAFTSSASSSWWLHEPAPHGNVPISTTSPGGNLIDQANPAVRAFFRSYVRSHYNSDDGLLMDGQAPGLSEELYNSSCGCSRTREITSNRALMAAHEAMAAAMTHRNGAPFLQIDNALAPNPFLPQGFNLLHSSTGVDGLMIEGEPENDGTLDPYYSTLLDQIASAAHRRGAFVVPLSYGAAGASYQQQSRRVQEATILLGYSPGHLVDWPDLEQGSRDLAVFPEEGIYPTDPVQSMRAPRGRGCLAGRGDVCSRGGHNSLRVAHGVYRREFSACYDRNARIGSCAAIVNTTGSWVTVRSSWLSRTYRHQITFVGGDVQSGGSLNLAAPFAAGVTAIAPYDAVLLDS